MQVKIYEYCSLSSNITVNINFGYHVNIASKWHQIAINNEFYHFARISN